MIVSATRHLEQKGLKKCFDPSLCCSKSGKSAKLIVNDRNRVRLIKIDGCLIQNGKKCDYLFLYQRTLSKKYLFLVELKGSHHFQHALDQLEATNKNPIYQALFLAVDTPPKSVKVKAVIIIGPKAKTNRPRKEEAEIAIGMRLHVEPQDRGECLNLVKLAT